MKKKNLLMMLVAFALVLSTSIGTSWAYFTTYCTAKGGYTIHLGSQTEIHEEYSNGHKRVTITNKADSNQAVYVRVKAFCASKYPLVYTGADWAEGGDGYYYCKKSLYPGETSPELDIEITNVPRMEDIPETERFSQEFNVIVVYEATPVTYNTDGSEVGWDQADWSAKLLLELEDGKEGA